MSERVLTALTADHDVRVQRVLDARALACSPYSRIRVGLACVVAAALAVFAFAASRLLRFDVAGAPPDVDVRGFAGIVRVR